MKFFINTLIIVFCFIFFSACSIANFYNTSKSIYIANKEVIVANFDSLDKETQDKLIKLDNKAKLINNGAESIKIIVNTKNEIEELIKEDIELSKKNIEIK